MSVVDTIMSYFKTENADKGAKVQPAAVQVEAPKAAAPAPVETPKDVKNDKPVSAAPKYAAPSLFKDYNKATKDIITKNHTAGNVWKVESKHKCKKNSFVVNPMAVNEKISCDIEYVHECGGSIKMNVTPQLFDNNKNTFTFEKNGHKVEAILHLKENNAVDYEISHQTAVLFHKRASINEKINKKAVELGLGVDVAPQCQIGCGATYNLKEKSCNWNLGCRYFNQKSKCEMAITTNQFKTYTTSMSGPLFVNLPIESLKTKCGTVMLAVETICGKDVPLKASVGLENKCPVFPSNVLKVKVDNEKKWALTYVTNLSDWSVSATIDNSMKPGVVFTHS